MAKIKVTQKQLVYGGLIIVGIAIVARLMRNPAAASEITKEEPKPAFPLAMGSRGDLVKQLQMFINEKFKYVGKTPLLKVDGIWGAKTEQAVKDTFGQLNTITEKTFTDNVLSPSNLTTAKA